ncbi:hypothetical protein ACJX0J_014410, partial [Zea mays]
AEDKLTFMLFVVATEIEGIDIPVCLFPNVIVYIYFVEFQDPMGIWIQRKLSCLLQKSFYSLPENAGGADAKYLID